MPDEVKNWKDWSMETQFNEDKFVFKIGTETVFQKTWAEMNNVKPSDFKVLGHFHRAHSGTWKRLSICQGTISIIVSSKHLYGTMHL